MGKNKLSPKGFEQLIFEEALRLTTYRCTAGKLTIGIGHTGADVKEGMTITKERAYELYLNDSIWVNDVIKKYIKIQLTQNQYDALFLLIFNIGETNFAKSSVLHAINSGNNGLISAKWQLFNKTRDRKTGKLVVSKTLVGRRLREVTLYIDGKYHVV